MAALLLVWVCCQGSPAASTAPPAAAEPIDRQAVVGRHRVRFASPRPVVGEPGYCTPKADETAFNQLTVGNGDFAFTADLTGLQSLNASYGSTADRAFPALTMASWGWHTPDPKRVDPTMPSLWRADGSLNLTYQHVRIVSLDDRPGHGNRTIPYLVNCTGHNDPRLCHYWYNFPVRTSLGQLAFATAQPLANWDRAVHTAPLRLETIRNSTQDLDLYTGVLSSNFSVGEHRVRVTTVADDRSTDSVALRFTSPTALALTVKLTFCAPGTVPIGTHTVGNTTYPGNGGNQACDWLQPDESHTTSQVSVGDSASGSRLDLARKLDFDEYSVSCVASSGSWVRTGPHAFALSLPGSSAAAEQDERTVSVSCRFALGCCVGTALPKTPTWLSEQPVPAFGEAFARSVASARSFWEHGAFIDLAGNTSDPRAHELERLVVQSMSLLRTMETGAAPPQEAGLLFNSWSGKHHQEMRMWHQAWLPVWGRPELLDRSWEWFLQNLPNATSEARRQGYPGARFHKMVRRCPIAAQRPPSFPRPSGHP